MWGKMDVWVWTYTRIPGIILECPVCRKSSACIRIQSDHSSMQEFRHCLWTGGGGGRDGCGQTRATSDHSLVFRVPEFPPCMCWEMWVTDPFGSFQCRSSALANGRGVGEDGMDVDIYTDPIGSFLSVPCAGIPPLHVLRNVGIRIPSDHSRMCSCAGMQPPFDHSRLLCGSSPSVAARRIRL
jgi:hypothetical protein